MGAVSNLWNFVSRDIFGFLKRGVGLGYDGGIAIVAGAGALAAIAGFAFLIGAALHGVPLDWAIPYTGAELVKSVGSLGSGITSFISANAPYFGSLSTTSKYLVATAAMPAGWVVYSAGRERLAKIGHG